ILTSIPLIDSIRELYTRITASPCSLCNLIPQFLYTDIMINGMIYSAIESPILIFRFTIANLLNEFHEVIRNRDRVIYILTRDSFICFTGDTSIISHLAKCSNFILFMCLPLDKILDLWVIHI